MLQFQTPDSWDRYEFLEGWPDQLETVRSLDGGLLELVPRPCVWYAPLRAPLLYRTVRGDFDARTCVRVHGRSQDVPSVMGSLGGLMLRQGTGVQARDWKRPMDNYVVFATGVASGTSGFDAAIEITSTVNGQSGLETYRSEHAWTELRIIRLGAVLALLHRFEGADWQFTQLSDVDRTGEFDYQGSGLLVRPDLPEELQVGLTVMADWGTILNHAEGGFDNEYFRFPERFNRQVLLNGHPDTRAIFKGTSIRSVEVPPHWHRKNLAREPHLAQWLEVFGN